MTAQSFRLSGRGRLRRKPTGAVVARLANGAEASVGRRYVPGLQALLRAVER